MNSSRYVADTRGAGHIAVKTNGEDLYGRRIEADRSWTVYHVFTGVPAIIEGRAMVGLGLKDATDDMLAMNLGNSIRARRDHVDAPPLDIGQIRGLGWC
jgi:hypothetical protein